MDYRLTPEDKERIKLLDEVAKNKFLNFSLEQLIRLQELIEKKDYGNEKRLKNLNVICSNKSMLRSTSAMILQYGNNQVTYK